MFPKRPGLPGVCEMEVSMDRQLKAEGRRSFLKLAATGVPAAVAAMAVGTQAVAGVTVETEQTLGLRKTEHVKKYLDSARF